MVIPRRASHSTSAFTATPSYTNAWNTLLIAETAFTNMRIKRRNPMRNAFKNYRKKWQAVSRSTTARARSVVTESSLSFKPLRRCGTVVRSQRSASS